jgi:hypothetical protein
MSISGGKKAGNWKRSSEKLSVKGSRSIGSGVGQLKLVA